MAEDLVHTPEACDDALARAFGFLGKRWNGLIIGVLAGGPATFTGLRRAVGGISDSVLSDRLTELAAAGLVQRTVDDGPPVAVSYQLTDAGRSLTPVLEQLTTWARESLPAQSCAGRH
ncbi:MULTISPECIES: winged helix-turn-helix transcriptional regulator [unclassified Modestobacter]|uniref:winged helix-turn-helix transcriptional regulator n=1 Tax=unclassified Modestobacter TaxID=2643866 RepID=UPI0022AA52D4|nr:MULTISPECIES: helix-turn-helix domain-containing protein [unclassified Modestobacter]MCZ2821329.1 helix-turn-helix domain-containing protein [Modestobacter sp. VKM Ac-2977]MCZ2822891.1 helix-turn-helix domain-containing protein [Modestobacter sp. VKM Ac-2981]MCZ2849445.1 helix-turn-helix domain-containing protein [Modestobacter sp. VKM Ac-2978]MCZ2851137.1 helix-turn-helix domain-containing protein [Modestobacter sp. VKM Ac-2982]